MSLAELDQMVPKDEAPVYDQLERLREADVIEGYVQEPNTSTRDLPSKSRGPTGHGIERLHDHNFRRGVPIARAVYEETKGSERVMRHEGAPRPDLPEAVAEALGFDEPSSE